MSTEQNSRSTGGGRGGWALTLGVCALLIGGAIALFVVLSTQAPEVSGFERAQDQPLFPEFAEKTGEAQRIEIVSRGQKFTVSAEGETWRLEERDGYPVAREPVEALLKSMAEVRALFVSVEDPPPFPDFGLDDPGRRVGSAVAINVHNSDGERLAGLVLGDRLSVGLDVLKAARRAGDGQLLLTSWDPVLSTNPLEWIPTHIIDIPQHQISKIDLTSAQGDRIIDLRRSERGELYVHHVAGLQEERKAETPAILTSIAGALERLEFEDVRSRKNIVQEAEKGRSAHFKTEQGVALSIEFVPEGPDTDQQLALINAAPDEAAPEEARRLADDINNRHGEWAYRLPRYVVELLTLQPQELEKR